MTTEDLMKPRYKVFGKYPSMELEPFHLGQVITLTRHDTDGWIHIPIKHIPGSYMRIEFFENFPNIFEPLAWWKDRKVEDMPEYLKWLESGAVCKPNKFLGNYVYLGNDQFSYHIGFFSPATEADYNAWEKEVGGE